MAAIIIIYTYLHSLKYQLHRCAFLKVSVYLLIVSRCPLPELCSILTFIFYGLAVKRIPVKKLKLLSCITHVTFKPLISSHSAQLCVFMRIHLIFIWSRKMHPVTGTCKWLKHVLKLLVWIFMLGSVVWVPISNISKICGQIFEEISNNWKNTILGGFFFFCYCWMLVLWSAKNPQ